MSSIRSLRNNRSSRYSSPATFASNHQEPEPAAQETIEVQPPQNGVERLPQSRLDHWVEPVVRHGVASFEDTKGLERVGVLEHMQPLGVAPNPKLLSRLKVNLSRPSASARGTPGQSEGVASPSVEPASAKDDAPSPVIDPELLIETPPLPLQPLPQTYHEPQPQLATFPQSTPPPVSDSFPQLSSPVIMSPPRGRPAKKEVEEMRVYGDENAVSPAFTNTSRQSRASPRHSSIQEHQKEERFKGYIRSAISKASQEGKDDVVSGLTSVLAEAGRDELLTALENISKYKGSVRVEQFKVFKHYIKKGIRKHRRNSSLYNYNNDDDDNDSNPSIPALSQQTPVAYVSSFHANIKKPSPVGSPKQSDTVTRSPLTLRTTFPDVSNNVSPPKLFLHSPSQTEHAPMDIPPSQHDESFPVLPQKRTPRKRRSSSTSSLSSAISVASSLEPVPNLLPGSNIRDQSSEAKPARSAGSRQAPIRAASSRATRLSGTDQQQTDLSQFEARNTKNLNIVNNNSEAKRRKLLNRIATAPDYDQAEVDRRRREFDRNLKRDVREGRETVHLRRPISIPEGEDDLTSITVEPRPPPPVIHPNSLVHATAQASSPATAEFPTVNGTSKKRDYDEFTRDDLSSRLSTPDTISSTDLPAPHIVNRLSSAAPSSRAPTPRAAKNGQMKPTQLIKGRTSLRTMISPKKPKNDGSSTGVIRAGPENDTVMTNGTGADAEENQNEDECRACGDAGLLVLCESCPNSFHPGCLEPPLDPDDPKLAEDQKWYCPLCEAKRRPETAKSDGFMSELISNVSDAYPKAYNLPQDIRDYFENVSTGADGEYVEAIVPPTNKRWPLRADNNGAVKLPNYKDIRDRQGNLRFCYKCGKGTDGERDMMPCDYCPKEWHLDCLDPPAPVVPKRIGADGKAPPPWRCPLHVDHDMIEISRAGGLETGMLGRIPRLRRPRRQVRSVQQSTSRPLYPNNGVIDIEHEPESEVTLKEIDMQGTVQKIPEKGIRLDFIAKANRDRYNEYVNKDARGIVSHQTWAKSWLPDHPRFRDQPAPLTSDITTPEQQEQRSRFYSLSLPDQQVILSLSDLKNSTNSTNGLNRSTTDRYMDDLVNVLIAEAPAEVSRQTNMSEVERLTVLEDLIKRRKDILTRASTNSGTTQADLPPMQTKSKKVDTPKVNGTLGHDHSE
ncbi:hypothetical protein LTS08_003198 [Lithohypha guttulata]|nr:hypothetical protein LTS08_003198 [Lithohypha guttulata]